MAKTKKYNVCISLLWPLYCLCLFVLAIVLAVLLCFGHCIVCTSLFWLQWPKQRSTNNTMAKAKKNRQYNGQSKEVQTIQWAKQRSTNNTMAKAKKNFVLAIVLFVLLSFGHCIVCASLFWPLYCLYFFVFAIVLSVLLCYTMAKAKKNRQYNGQSKEVQTIQWPKQRSTNNTMAKGKKYKQ
jgi:Flp pilus assembly protein TadB